jgi:hypothetical protein
MTLIDDYIADCQLRGIRYPKTAIYYIRDFATTCEDPQNANRADLKRYLAIPRGRNLKQSSVMKAYNHLSGFYVGQLPYASMRLDPSCISLFFPAHVHPLATMVLCTGLGSVVQ